MNRERAIELARKLAFINETNATENEVLLAAEHLARIARDHNLSKLDLTPEQIRQQGVKSEQVKADCDRRAKRPLYVTLLISRLAGAFGVRVVFLGNTPDVKFFGDETNITLLKFFLEQLLKAIPKLRWKAKCESGVAGASPIWKESWERGFIDAIGDRMDKIMQAMTKEQATRCRALAVVTKVLINEAVNIAYPQLGPLKLQLKVLDARAYKRGSSDGKTARLQESL